VVLKLSEDPLVHVHEESHKNDDVSTLYDISLHPDHQSHKLLYHKSVQLIVAVTSLFVQPGTQDTDTVGLVLSHLIQGIVQPLGETALV